MYINPETKRQPCHFVGPTFVLRGVNKEVQVGSELARFADHALDGLFWIHH